MNATKHKSKTVSNAPTSGSDATEQKDSRALRTRRQIDSAFVLLLHRRSYDNIRVGDITRKAGVGRATFYAHFASKDDLLRSQLKRVVLPMLRAQPLEPYLLDCQPFFEHVRNVPHLHKSLMSGGRNGANVIREELQQHLDQTLKPASHCIDCTLPESLVIRFVISALLGVVTHALSNVDRPRAEEMQRLFQKLVGSGLAA